ncbi:MAG: sigma-E processing peptidase SpoIIGA, partial [Eubacterium sp.]|nr:sigma-E processing peptidase SpoIIGA [Eubacterium sp.]
IVVDKAIAKDLFKDEKSRLIPASTVNKASFLEGYKPEYVLIKTPEQTYKTDKVYIALSEQLKTKSFSAVLNPEILSV